MKWGGGFLPSQSDILYTLCASASWMEGGPLKNFQRTLTLTFSTFSYLRLSVFVETLPEPFFFKTSTYNCAYFLIFFYFGSFYVVF